LIGPSVRSRRRRRAAADGGRLDDVAIVDIAGGNGWLTAFVKGILCNSMTAFGTVLGLSSTKITAIWLPVSTFCAIALECAADATLGAVCSPPTISTSFISGTGL